jgi:hypothetical protein
MYEHSPVVFLLRKAVNLRLPWLRHWQSRGITQGKGKENKMKKNLAAVAGLCIALSLGACGKSGKPADASDGAQEAAEQVQAIDLGT